MNSKNVIKSAPPLELHTLDLNPDSIASSLFSPTLQASMGTQYTNDKKAYSLS